MDVILNIGLARNDGPHVAVREVLAALEGSGLWPRFSHTAWSDTEPTFVLTCDFLPNSAGNATPAQACHRLAVALGQDCIAAWLPRQRVGRLIGPRADAWGAFNPEFFIMPDGTRLSQSAVQVAA